MGFNLCLDNEYICEKIGHLKFNLWAFEFFDYMKLENLEKNPT